LSIGVGSKTLLFAVGYGVLERCEEGDPYPFAVDYGVLKYSRRLRFAVIYGVLERYEEGEPGRLPYVMECLEWA
jgi:hypothetical protein